MLKSDMMNKSRMFFKPKSNIPAFLVKTYDIIDNPVHFDIISWNKEGNAFVVKNVNEFSEKILPKYFKHNNFSSFVRQLNMYDFHKSKQDGKENEFKHKLFKRGQKHLLADIKRKGSDSLSYGEEPMMGVGPNRGAEINKVKKSANIINDELSSVKSQQAELERMGKMIYTQNSQLLNENKLLWEELNKNKDKYDKKVEKLMMFICSLMNQPGGPQLGPSDIRKMLPNSDNLEFAKMPAASQEQSTASPQSIQQKDNLTSSPEIRPNPILNTQPVMPTMVNGANMMPNGAMLGTPIMPNVFANPQYQNVYNGTAVPILPNTYNAHPYFAENSTSPNNQTATTSGNNLRKENPIVARPVPPMDSAESKEFRENPTKIMKKENETSPLNPLQINNQVSSSIGALDDPMKMEDWQVPGMSRGLSYNNGDLNFSRFNSLNAPRVPSSLDPTFNPMFIQNLRSNGESLGLYPEF